MIITEYWAVAIYVALFLILFTVILNALEDMRFGEDGSIVRYILAFCVTVLCLIQLWHSDDHQGIGILLPYEALGAAIVLLLVPAFLGILIGLCLRWYTSPRISKRHIARILKDAKIHSDHVDREKAEFPRQSDIRDERRRLD